MWASVWRRIKYGGIPISLIISLGSLYLDAQDAQQFGWAWQYWAMIGVAGLTLSGGSVMHDLWQENRKLTALPKPNVVFDGFDYAPNQTVRIPNANINTSQYSEFVRLRFVNEPETRGFSADVPNLHAYIEIRDDSGQRVVLTVPDGRWADNPDHGEGASRDLKSVNIPGSGESRILDIAMRTHGQPECYAWAHTGTRIDSPSMPPGRYQVFVELDGSNMTKRHFRFVLIHHEPVITEREGGASPDVSEDRLELIEQGGFENTSSARWNLAKQGN